MVDNMHSEDSVQPATNPPVEQPHPLEDIEDAAVDIQEFAVDLLKEVELAGRGANAHVLTVLASIKAKVEKLL